MPSGVFQDATVDTVILFLNKEKTQDLIISSCKDEMITRNHIIDVERFYKNEKYLFDIQTSEADIQILNKVKSDLCLQDVLDISTGIKEYQV